MATIQKQLAVERLTQAVLSSDPDDLVEIYNELFPQEPQINGDAVSKRDFLLTRVTTHIQQGLEIEEILDLWNVVFPGHRRVWFDEEDEQLHYDESSETPVHVD